MKKCECSSKQQVRVVWKGDVAYVGDQRVGNVYDDQRKEEGGGALWAGEFGVGNEAKDGWYEHWIIGDVSKDLAKAEVERCARDLWDRLHRVTS